jgi:signal transduction histidine kinase
MIARLERSFEETRRFTADAAHELRTPLAVMRSAVEVALRSPREPEHYRRVLCEVLEEIERLSRLAEQLLFLCREDSGLARLASIELRFDDLVRGTVEHMAVVANAKGLALQTGDISPCSIRGDADQLRRLLFNLLDNAIKFTPVGGRVGVTLNRLNGHASVVVSDTGIGISPEQLPRVFDRFYRVDPARGPEADGTGLGLAICRSIAEAHGGRMVIESVPGEGTRATFTLPVHTLGANAAERIDNPQDGNGRIAGALERRI